MNSKCWRASPAFINATVYLDPKGCERKGCIVLMDILTKPVGLWRCCCEEMSELLRWGYHGWKFDIAVVTTHCEERVSIGAPSACCPF